MAFMKDEISEFQLRFQFKQLKIGIVNKYVSLVFHFLRETSNNLITHKNNLAQFRKKKKAEEPFFIQDDSFFFCF